MTRLTPFHPPTASRARRHATRRMLAAAAALALGATMTVPSLGATAHADDAVEVVDGTLDWGVRASFRDDVSGPIAAGTIATTDGASRNDDGTIRFVDADGGGDAGSLEASLAGTVRFTGHATGGAEPLLDLRLSAPTVAVDGDTGTLTVDVRSRGLADPDTVLDLEDVVFATLDLSAADVTVTDDTYTATDVPATLTDAGAEAFAGFYEAGAPLDPLDLTLELAPLAEPAEPVDAAVDVDVVTGLDPEGQDITVVGTGFDPSGNRGARPPLAGQPAGVYVAVARIDDPWAPSAGAPGAARRIVEQRWALPEASLGSVPGSGTVLMEADGSFEVTLEARTDTDAEDLLPGGSYAVIVYPGSGAINPAEEFAIPLTFGTDDGDDSGDDTGDDSGNDNDHSGNDDKDDGNDDGGGDGDGGNDRDDHGGDDTGDVTTGVITDGTLDWGVKSSFRSYVEGPIADGTITTTEGAERNPDGTVRFTAPEGEVDADVIDAAFDGTVRFTGHRIGGEDLLDLTLSSPTIALDGDAGTLVVDVRSRGLEDPDTVLELEQVAVGALDLSGVTLDVDAGIVTADDIPVTLTSAGAEAFAGFYDEGEVLDVVDLALAIDGTAFEVPAPPAGTGDPVTAPDPAGTTPPPAAGAPPVPPTVPSAALPPTTVRATPSASGSLPRTGTDTAALVLAGLVALATGGLALRRTRRRRTASV